MAVSYAELKEQVSKDAELETLLKLAVFAGFPARSWQSGSVPRTLLEIEAETLSELTNIVGAIAQGGFLDDAEDDWLDALAKSVFDEERVPGVKTQGDVELTCAATAGPYTIAVGQLWAADAGGKRFTNITGGVLASGGTLTLSFEAEEVGGDYNIPGSTLTILLTPLAGVTINNPDGLDGWTTQSGADEETDEQLRDRCRAKWATQGTGATTDSYVFWAKTASAEVKRVNVLEHNNLGTAEDGHVTLYLAGDSGDVSAQAVTDVDDFIDERRPLCTTIHVASATEIVVTVTATVRVETAKKDTAETEITQLFTELGQELPIGATVYVAEIIERLMTPDGVSNAVATAPASDTALAVDEVASFTLDLTWDEV